MTVRFELNGKPVVTECPPERRLSEILRREFGMKRTKASCYGGECGSCSVLLDGELVPSCIIPAFTVRNRSVMTIEGFMKTKDYADISKGFKDAGYSPCEYCVSGKVLAAHSLIEAKPDPEEPDIREMLGGNSCTCSDYSSLVNGVMNAAMNRKRRIRAKKA